MNFIQRFIQMTVLTNNVYNIKVSSIIFDGRQVAVLNPPFCKTKITIVDSTTYTGYFLVKDLNS